MLTILTGRVRRRPARQAVRRHQGRAGGGGGARGRSHAVAIAPTAVHHSSGAPRGECGFAPVGAAVGAGGRTGPARGPGAGVALLLLFPQVVARGGHGQLIVVGGTVRVGVVG